MQNALAQEAIPQGRLFSARDLAARLGVSERTIRWRCQVRMYQNAFEGTVNNQSGWMIPEASLPPSEQALLAEAIVGSQQQDTILAESDALIYSKAPDWSKKQADKYLAIIRDSAGLKGRALKEFIASYNEAHPDLRTSYSRLLIAREQYELNGVAGLLSNRGWRAGKNEVDDVLFEEFKALWMQQGQPSTKSCWLRVLGSAKRRDPNLDYFPSPASFMRRIKKEIPEQAQFLARHGHDAWYRKYACYVDRDYSNIRAGQVWVGDHHQLDVCVINPINGKPCFPWVTVWTDFKSGKWLGWFLHCDSPNSDHIFESFYLAASKYGLPVEIIIDNGKDYRARDFAGGKQRLRVSVDTSSEQMHTIGLLEIRVHFALAYNAQTKTIERSFRAMIDLFCRHMVGYRGSNITVRPEKLDGEIKSGCLLSATDFSILFDTFITTCLNKKQSAGKNHKGKCPDQVWANEFTEKRPIGNEALALFCMRTTGILTIGRNGVLDGETGLRYWSEFFPGLIGTKVYLRRSQKDVAEAWVFDARDRHLICMARIGEFCAPALAETELELSQVRSALAKKRHNEKIVKAYAQTCAAPDPMELTMKLAASLEHQNRGPIPEADPKIHHIPNTAMDKVIRQRADIETQGTADISDLVPEHFSDAPLFATETDRELYQQRMRKTA